METGRIGVGRRPNPRMPRPPLVKMMRKRFGRASRSLVVSAACLLLLPLAVVATSGRNVYTELAGLKVVYTFLDAGSLPGLDEDDLARRVAEQLVKGGLTVRSGFGTPQLEIRVVRNYLKSDVCPGMVSVQVTLSLKDTVTLRRNAKLGNIRAATWESKGFAFIMSEDEAGAWAKREVLGSVDGFASDVAYATQVVANAKTAAEARRAYLSPTPLPVPEGEAVLAFGKFEISPCENAGDRTDPHLRRAPSVEYPEVARKARMEGTVTVTGRVLIDGVVGSVQVEKGLNPLLDATAVRAVRDLSLEPAHCGTQALESSFTATIRFSLQ
jgi:TonB family protein